ncbi:XRE family transcriptional regulator [Legionella feeleii]|uniref:Putative transcriptional regulator (Helix-turn-helix motif, XRE-like) n=1 Tax=Legionella feeleii TaxID=453 RepID=A0A378IXW6_9GAMM|nr:XRE family transcriptional regulator [Legionella feeleii]STX39740.1 putative transcriptional regulator (helix-turn-helix motif, XRE-like) [Legionella feeleii]
MLGNRIQRARKASGLSLRDLGEQIALSHAAIKKYEDNEVTPSSDVLIKLAKALHVKVEYFFRPERFTLQNIQYRKHADMPPRQLEEISAIVLDQIERRVELEGLFPIPPVQPFSIKNLPKIVNQIEDVEKLADQIRKQWNLGSDPMPDLIDIFEENGIKVFQIDNEQYPKIDGLYVKVNEIPIFVVSNQSPGDRQRFTLAHELGHLLLDSRLEDSLDIESYCNRFAGAFLLPKQSLINVLGIHRNSIEPRELSLLKQEFGISMTSILHRAEETGIISNNIYRQIRAEFNDRGWSKKEPGEQYPKEITRIFEQMIFHALAEQYIGESKAAELMNMPLESFRSLRAMESQDVACHQ